MLGLNIVFNDLLLKDSDVRNFQFSKNRSKRIHKKLVKRYGSEFRKVPVMYQMGNTVFAHPFFKHELSFLQREGKAQRPEGNIWP